MHTHVTDAPTSAPRVSALRTFMVSGIGTALEYYDFLIYGLAASLVFNVIFFPDVDPVVGTLYAFAAFGTGFLARPLGGIVIGHFGDRIGRRPMLVMTLIAMGLSTLAIGFLPTYETIGVAAPILLVVFRLIQGFAAGGEWGGAALFGIENAPPRRRGLWGSFTSMGIGLGTLLGISVFAITSTAAGGDLLEFAWRVPFWLGGLLIVIGLVARLKMPREEAVQRDDVARLPLVEMLRTRPRQVLLILGVSFGYNTIAYLGFTFFLSYLTTIGYESAQALVAQLAYSAVLIVSAPLAALLSDVVGRKRVMTIGGVAMAAFMFAYFPIVGTQSIVMAAIAFAITGLLTGITQGPIPTFAGEQFPARLRYSGMSAGYQVGAAIGGGTASLVATWLLIAFDQNPIAVSVYGAFVMAVLIACSLGLRETSRLDTAEINEG